MAINPPINSATIAKRMELMKSGFKKYTSIRKIPMDAETKWSLEIVALSPDYAIPANFMQDVTISANQKGKLYTAQTIQSFCAKLNASKSQWIEVMKA